MAVDVLLCDFHPQTGWRVRRAEVANAARIAVVHRNGSKLLQIPVIRTERPGRFCNPKTRALEYVRAIAARPVTRA